MSSFQSKNATGSNGNNIEPNADGSVNVVGELEIVETSGDEKYHSSGAITATPDIEQDLITVLVGAGKTQNLYVVTVHFRFDSCIRVLVDGTEIESGSTSGFDHKLVLNWRFGYPINAGETLTVKFEALASSPADTVKAFAQAVET